MRESRIACAASSRSASGNTTTGALPPNSRDTFVMLFAAAFMMLSPAPTEPVTLTISIFGDAARALPITEPLPVTTLKSPFGNPVSSTTFANSQQFSGVSCAGFITIEQPAIRAAPALRAMRKNGKFQGRIPATTPIGFLEIRIDSPLLSLSTISPSICLAKEAM